MPVPTPQTLSQLTGTFVNAFVASSDPAFGFAAGNIAAGDPVIALGFAVAAIAMSMQQEIQDEYAFSRASTATGSDLDSWQADFGYVRAPGAAAVGTATIPTATGAAAAAPIPIPQGTIILTQPITVAPSTVPSVYQFATTSAVTLPAGQSSVVVPFQATAVGSNYNNIPSNTPLQLGVGIGGLGAPTFLTGPQLGSNSASDPQARTDFIQYIDSLQLGTLAAIVAAIQDAEAGLVNGQNLAVYDYATAPGAAQPGQIVAAFIEAGKSGQYTGSPDDPIADAVLQAMTNTCAFGATPLVYYARATVISALTIQFSYSQSALTNAQINLSQLENLLAAVLQSTFPAGGGQLGQRVPFAKLSALFLNLTVQTSAAVVGGLVTDFYTPAAVVVTTDHTFNGASDDAIFPSISGAFNPLGYLTLATSVVPTFTAIAGA